MKCKNHQRKNHTLSQHIRKKSHKDEDFSFHKNPCDITYTRSINLGTDSVCSLSGRFTRPLQTAATMIDGSQLMNCR